MSALGLLIVTLLSGALAAVMSAIAWRVAREERLRAEARIAALALEIHADDVVLDERAPVSPRPREIIEDLPLRHRPAVTTVPAFQPFHATVRPTASASRFGMIAVIGLFAFATIAALAVWLRDRKSVV